MPESPPSRGRTATQRGPARDTQGGSDTLPALRVRYYKRMRPNKVYPVTVGWRSKGGSDAGPVQVRLIMAGAQVVPAEHVLDPGEPDAKVTFYVTPLARGWLRGERLEILQNGRKVSELKTPAKVNTQRFTRFLLLLTILVPWFLFLFFTEPLRDLERAPDQHPDTPAEEVKYTALSPGPTLTKRIKSVAAPLFPFLEQNETVKPYTPYVTEIPDKIGDIYSFLFYSYQNEKIPYYSFWILLLLTLISYWWHRETRTARTGKPVALEGG